MAKDLHITFLLDFYGDMLTDKQREVVECYYNEDLSLAEIAEEKGITRQGVRDAIKRAEQQLIEMEERLGLAKRFRMVQEELAVICDRALQIEEENEKNGGNDTIRENVEAILLSAKKLVD
ncbi:MAG: YlxM family DNA-binding protein [Hominenteromicrobium sp.]